MMKCKKDFYAKTLLMLGLAGAMMGVSHISVSQAGYDDDSSESYEIRATHRAALIQTLSEEKTEINTLASQQAKFREMGDAESTQLARLWGRMIRDHKAAGPTVIKLIRLHGGDPADAKILKAPVLGDKEEMIMATHKDHEAAVMTSQMRYMIAKSHGDTAVMKAMRARANIARSHIRLMAPYHEEHNH